MSSYDQIEQKISRVSLQGTVLSFLNILCLECISFSTSMNATKAKATKSSYIILENSFIYCIQLQQQNKRR